MARLTEREMVHVINAVEKTNRKICKEILNDNTEALELFEILICSLYNLKGDYLKTVQLQKATI